MSIIYESKYYFIETRNPPHISREDGGHLVISPKAPLKDRTEMTAEQAKEFIKLSMIAGTAMSNVMNKQGIELGRINYQDNGNFNTKFHLHLYGRALNSKNQPFGTTLSTPKTKEEFLEYIKNLEPLNEADISLLNEEINRLSESDKYKNF